MLLAIFRCPSGVIIVVMTGDKDSLGLSGTDLYVDATWPTRRSGVAHVVVTVSGSSAVAYTIDDYNYNHLQRRRRVENTDTVGPMAHVSVIGRIGGSRIF